VKKPTVRKPTEKQAAEAEAKRKRVYAGASIPRPNVLPPFCPWQAFSCCARSVKTDDFRFPPAERPAENLLARVPDKPVPSGFHIFQQENKSLYSGANFEEYAKLASKAWAALSDAEKKVGPRVPGAPLLRPTSAMLNFACVTVPALRRARRRHEGRVQHGAQGLQEDADASPAEDPRRARHRAPTRQVGCVASKPLPLPPSWPCKGSTMLTTHSPDLARACLPAKPQTLNEYSQFVKSYCAEHKQPDLTGKEAQAAQTQLFKDAAAAWKAQK
jgi:hypothetical protein